MSSGTNDTIGTNHIDCSTPARKVVTSASGRLVRIQPLQIGEPMLIMEAYDGQLVIGKTNGISSRRLFKMAWIVNTIFRLGDYGITGENHIVPT